MWVKYIHVCDASLCCNVALLWRTLACSTDDNYFTLFSPINRQRLDIKSSDLHQGIVVSDLPSYDLMKQVVMQFNKQLRRFAVQICVTFIASGD